MCCDFCWHCAVNAMLVLRCVNDTEYGIDFGASFV